MRFRSTRKADTNLSVFRQPLLQLRPSPPPRHVADGDGGGFLLPDDHDQFLASRYASVEQISLQHRVMLGHDRDHYGGIFRPLALVNGRGIGWIRTSSSPNP